MPLLPAVIRQRRLRRAFARRNLAGRAGLGVSLLVSLLFLAGAVWLAFFAVDLTRDLPSPDQLPLLLDPPHGTLLQPTRLYDRSDRHLLLSLEHPAAARRYLPFQSTAGEHLPQALVQATIAAADPGFWNHPGYTLDGLLQGNHSTLAQRLVADLLLWNESPGPRRNLRERLLAGQVTARYGREKVLEWYLNSARYGRLVYGAEAAAQYYFGKPASRLSLAEAAMLAAVAEAPELNPQQAPQVPLERQKAILLTMASLGLIEEEQARQALFETMHLRPVSNAAPGAAPAFTRLVLEHLAVRFPPERLERGGLHVRTSLDYDLQMQVECAVQAQIARAGPGHPGQGEPITAAGNPCEAARLLPTLPPSSAPVMNRLDAQAVVLDPHTGQVLALVGETATGQDPAVLPGSSPGTLLTPFIYLTAFTRGWSPASLLWDIPANLESASNQPNPTITPEPEAGLAVSYTVSPPPVEYHGPISLRTAFANDYLIPAESLLAQIGPENVWRTARQFGLKSLELSDLQAASGQASLLNAGETSLLEIGQAFGVFASQGVLAGQIFESRPGEEEAPDIQPVLALKVEDASHQVWLDCVEQPHNCSPAIRSVVSPQLAYLVTHVLSDETARWPSLKHPNPLEVGRPAAAKIGQVEGGDHAWTVGYTPQIVVGVWVGYPDRPSKNHANAIASGLWHAVLQYASRNDPPLNWNAPTGISNVEVCEPSGLLPTSLCPNVVTEVFLSGNEPTHPDTLYRAYQVNRETGRLATVFTPPELVESRVYMVFPPQAQTWARSTGLPIPPEAYDVISLEQASSPSVQIASPEMFAYLRGKVRITGTASGEDFDFYRLQAGQGLNPQEWVQIGEDVHQPVNEGFLGEWEVGGLDGLYALQLLVVRKDQRIDTAVIQVTIDNQAPRVTIQQPAAEQAPIAAGEPGTVFAVQAEDNLELAQVEFILDGEQIAVLRDAPYAIAWKVPAGQHIFEVKAADKAGNVANSKREFAVNAP